MAWQSESDFTVGQDRLHYATAGDSSRPPILCVHGWFGAYVQWASVVPMLQDTHYIIALDLLGHGKSEAPTTGDYSIVAQGMRVLALADHLQLGQFALMGHSMGGQISTMIAARLAPQRVTELVSVSAVLTGKLKPRVRATLPFYDWLSSHPRVFDWMTSLRGNVWAEYILYGSVWFKDMFKVPPAARANVAESAYRADNLPAIVLSGREIIKTDLTDDMANIRARTLVIAPATDAVVYTSDSELLAAKAPNVQLVRIQDSGHFPMVEQPAAFAAALEGFLVG